MEQDRIDIGKLIYSTVRELEKKEVDIETLIRDPYYFGLDLYPAQWVIIKSFYGLTLNEQEMAIMKRWEKEGRVHWHGQREYKELVVIAGMRSGKTFMGGLISGIELKKLLSVGNVEKHFGLAPHSPIFIFNVAVSATQASDTVFAQLEARLSSSPYFQSLQWDRSVAEEYRIGPIHVRRGHSNSAAQAGKTTKCVVFDEMSQYLDAKGNKRSGEQVYSILSKGTKTLGLDGKVVSISSPLSEDDQIIKLFHIAEHVEDMIAFWLPTWEINPHLPFDSFKQDFLRNPELTWRDFGAKPSASLEAFYQEPDRIRSVLDGDNCFWPDGSIKPQDKLFKSYFACADPAVVGDAMGFSVAHWDTNAVIVDGVYRLVPPKSQRAKKGEIRESDVKRICANIAHTFPIREFRFDMWMYVGAIQLLERMGVKVTNKRVTLDDHNQLKTAIYSEEVTLPEEEQLEYELSRLELQNGKKVIFERKAGVAGHGDMADAVAGVYSLARKPPKTVICFRSSKF